MRDREEKREDIERKKEKGERKKENERERERDRERETDRDEKQSQFVWSNGKRKIKINFSAPENKRKKEDYVAKRSRI